MEDLELNKVVRHMFWADNEIWKTVLSNDSAKSDPEIKRLLFHNHFTHYAFIKMWKSDKLTFMTESVFENIQSINEFIDNVDVSELSKIVEIPWSKYYAKETGKTPEPVTLKETIYQIVLHSHYHRAQINSRLRELQIAPPPVDYIIWLWEGQPE
jgi:uncharacterized damage-inducible protein DinB